MVLDAQRRTRLGQLPDPVLAEAILLVGGEVAQLGAEEKNRHSHRAQAARQMLALMQEVWQLG